MGLRETVQGMGEAVLRPAALLSDALRQPVVVEQVGHRPWPLPREPWLMGQIWEDLLFAHWRVPAAALEPIVPASLPLDLYDGSAWIGVTPFRVRGLRLRGMPPVPVLSSFPEVNVRTYVTVSGRPGIYFLSLDAASRPAVWAARRSYRLPYFRSEIETRVDGPRHTFAAKRVSGDGPSAELAVEYGPNGAQLPARPNSLERWLAERYCLYTLDERRQVYRGEIHHPPWPLQEAWAKFGVNTMALPFGLGLEDEPLLHFSARQDVALWPIQDA
jgi:uncharacterized protein YqjF (DUF2071 family)